MPIETFKTWLEMNQNSKNNFDEETLRTLLREAPHTRFIGALPPGFEFLNGCADLGFENLGLSPQDRLKLEEAFSGRGAVVPGTRFRLRAERALTSHVEPVDGTETGTLPPHWKQGVLVLGIEGNDPLYFGKRVREEQISHVDRSNYKDVGDGWVPK